MDVYRGGHSATKATVFLEFLGRLVRQQAGRKVFLIVDRHAVHKAKKAAKWLEENKEKIQLFFLPAYSPELNPDELLNQDLKSNGFRQGRARNKQDMMRNEGIPAEQATSSSESQPVF